MRPSGVIDAQQINIPAPAWVKIQRDAERKVNRQSNAEPSLRAKRITGQSAEKSFELFPRSARTVNRHRWVSRVDSGAREKPF